MMTQYIVAYMHQWASMHYGVRLDWGGFVQIDHCDLCDTGLEARLAMHIVST